MTDLEKFTKLYEGFGIKCKVVTSADSMYKKDGHLFVRLVFEGYPDNYATYSDKFEGYNGFHSTIVFSKDGAFISQGFWQ